ncbi:MAG: hypothetical protein AB1807_05460 [Pseudomonadota bacterium]
MTFKRREQPRNLSQSRIFLRRTSPPSTRGSGEQETKEQTGPYRSAIPPQEALAMMEKTVGTALDARCVAALKEAVARVEL